VLTDNLYWYRVKEFLYNHDGDTLKVVVDMGMRVCREVTLRIEGINSPELRGATLEDARVSRDAAHAWFTKPGRKLVVKTYVDPGSYDRYTAEVFDADTEECFNKFMVDSGYADTYIYKWG
jgi:micrococcal nuclease